MISRKITALLSASVMLASLAVPLTASADDTPRIVKAEKGNGSTYVKLENITEGIVIAAKYNNGRFEAVKTAPVTQDEIVINGIEADKVMVWNSLEKIDPICDFKDAEPVSAKPTNEPTEAPSGFNGVTVDFTAMSEVPVYSADNGQGFVEYSSAIMPEGFERQVAPASCITLSSADGAKITESTGEYLHVKDNSSDGDDFNYGGLIYRVDTGKPGLYHLEVTVEGTQSDTRIAPTGMNSGNLTGRSNWDNAGEVPRTSSAVWSGSTWTYDFGTGESFVEIEIEPTGLGTEADPKTVGIRSIKITPIAVREADGKPTIHIIGDSTQKTYTFNETISAWGQTLGNYFDKDKVNVINYSMGGRAMKSNYCEGRFNEILSTGRQGDYVFIHSAHNDETTSTNRFSRGAGVESGSLSKNNENYNKWLNMYVEAVKARGMTPVLVTGMPRVSNGRYSESEQKPNGFNPDSPGNMRAKAAADEQVGLVELYAGAKAYYDKLDAKEVAYIYNNTEAGETPAANAANGTNGDGTHYKEAAAKQFSRIILQSIYDQSVADTDIYTDKAIMAALAELMPESVQTAARTGDWSAVFPEMASDVSAVDVVPGAEKQAEANYYYRNNIEKALQLGLLHKDTANLFKPTQTITVGEYARGIEKAFGLESGALANYERTAAELEADSSLAIAETGKLSVASEPKMNTASAGDEAGEGDIAITVVQPEGGSITVYNDSAYNTETADIPSGVTADTVISDNAYFTLTAPSEIMNKANSSGVFADNPAVSTNYVEIRNNGTKQIKYNAKADGVITMYLRFDNTKLITCENKTDGTKATRYINDADAAAEERDSAAFGIATFEVKLGKSYELYANGGTGQLYGVKYASTDYPQSSERLNVSEGNSVRVSVVPQSGYVLGSILVDGEAVSSNKEYVFTASKSVTVSAELTAEPAMVETTIVAADAPLTREVMGAILYDAYQLADKTNIDKYIAQNGGVPSPSDPNYDPNIKYEGTPYIPITGWGALTDKAELNNALYAKVKTAYNLGLIRPETGIARGSVALGTELEPNTEVTRAKAAKSLVFAFILTQPQTGASQKLPAGFAPAAPADIELPNSSAHGTVYTAD